jgi:hypothetical protein
VKKTHALHGLETDNLLGFLALLGLLRALEHERPSWFPRAYFGGVPLRSQLTLAEDATEDAIAAAASAGCMAYAERFRFGSHSDLTFDGVTARVLLQESLHDDFSASVMSAMCSDAAVRIDGRVEPTPMCAMFGQGHQSFLDRLHTVSAGVVPRALKSKRNPPDLNDPAIIARALFAPWTRSDPTESFRWDFEEDRRYALRDTNPSTDAATTEHGANRLAILGFVSLQSAPTVRGARVNLATRSVSRGGKNRRPRITWPIWTRPASLEAMHAMLDDPELSEDEPSFDLLRRHGIEQLRRVNRIMTGKFISFTRAEALTGSVKSEPAAGFRNE